MQSEIFKLQVENIYAPRRIDSYLAQALGGKYSREEIKTALKKGAISLNAKVAQPKTLVQAGDWVEGSLLSHKLTDLTPESTPLKVVFEDESVMVIDKPAGMVVHPGAGNKKGTLVNALLGYGASLSSMGGKIRPGIVHRLDKDTSGLLLVAKDNFSHRKLQEQFATRSLSRTYLALVRGRIEFQEGHVEESIGRHSKIRQRMAVSKSPDAREAQTLYKVVQRYRYATLLTVKLLTGRTHQIRVHMAHLGHPVFNDSLYGKPQDPITGRQALHAAKIEFVHPKTGNIMSFESEIPEDFKQMLAILEKA